MDTRVVLVVGLCEELSEVARNTAKTAVRAQQRLHNECGLRRGALDALSCDRRSLVTQDGTADVGTVAIRIGRAVCAA